MPFDGLAPLQSTTGALSSEDECRQLIASGVPQSLCVLSESSCVRSDAHRVQLIAFSVSRAGNLPK